MTSMHVLLLLIAFKYGTASICPQVNHTVCNGDHPYHACVCAMSLKEEAPPEKSCNKLLKIERNRFPATSVIFKLDEHADHHDVFPEQKFREAVATSLRIDRDDIVLLRVRCVDDDEKLAVQFIVLKDKKKKKKVIKMQSEADEDDEMMDEEKENEFIEDEEEDDDEGTMVDYYEEEEERRRKKARRQRKNQTPRIYDGGDVLRAGEVVNRMKVHEMIDIEGEPNNTVLVVQTVLAGVAFALMCLLGVWRGLKKKEDDRYESVEQKV